MQQTVFDRRTTRWHHRTAAALAAALALAACASSGTGGGRRAAPVPESSAQTVEVPAPAARPTPAPPAIPERLLQPDATFTLADITDIALRNNPLTRTSYLQALSAAANLGSKKSAYYPTIDATVSGARGKAGLEGSTSGEALLTTYGPAVSLNMLLLDMGGRSANVEEARLGLLASDWLHNATVQSVVLGVQVTYVQYLNAKSQLVAATANVKTAQTALDAATIRHDAGVATIAEVLLAKTSLSQAQLSVDSLNGQVMALRGSLATAMGLPATTPYDVGMLPEQMPSTLADQAVEPLVEQAKAQRPDLAAALTQAEKASAHVRSVRSDGLPVLSASASAGRTYVDPSTYVDHGDSWSARLLLSVPLFTGFATTYNVEKAREDAAAAQAQADSLEQEVILQVWTSYYALQTANQLVKTSRDLLASAEQSERVAFGRYKEGVGTILDLLAAQSQLANARSQEIQARAQWFAALAQLAHDTGMASPALRATISITEEKTNP
jgi:outer membrane protein